MPAGVLSGGFPTIAISRTDSPFMTASGSSRALAKRSALTTRIHGRITGATLRAKSRSQEVSYEAAVSPVHRRRRFHHRGVADDGHCFGAGADARPKWTGTEDLVGRA